MEQKYNVVVSNNTEAVYVRGLFESLGYAKNNFNNFEYPRLVVTKENDNSKYTTGFSGVDGKSFGKRLTIEDLEDIVKKENSTTNRMEYFEKYLKGIGIQYKLDDKEDSQWHNMTSNALQYFQRSDIRLRDKPKTLFINTIEFKTIESLVKYVKNNYDLE